MCVCVCVCVCVYVCVCAYVCMCERACVWNPSLPSPLPFYPSTSGPWDYELVLRGDLYTQKHTQWYFFRVQNTRAGQTYRFTIINLYKVSQLGGELGVSRPFGAEIFKEVWNICAYRVSVLSVLMVMHMLSPPPSPMLLNVVCICFIQT